MDNARTHHSAAPPSYTEAEADTLFRPPPPPPHSVGTLALPIALPQTSSSPDAPFVRAYHQDWRNNGIEMEDWLRFVDGLNLSLVSSTGS